MVNTHRLLVTGHRIPYQAKRQKAIQGIDQWKNGNFYLVYRYTTWINRLSLATHRLFRFFGHR